MFNLFRPKNVDKIIGRFTSTRDKLEQAADYHSEQTSKHKQKAVVLMDKAFSHDSERDRAARFAARIDELLS
jgi:hypothetical protein